MRAAALRIAVCLAARRRRTANCARAVDVCAACGSAQCWRGRAVLPVSAPVPATAWRRSGRQGKLCVAGGCGGAKAASAGSTTPWQRVRPSAIGAAPYVARGRDVVALLGSAAKPPAWAEGPPSPNSIRPRRQSATPGPRCAGLECGELAPGAWKHAPRAQSGGLRGHSAPLCARARHEDLCGRGRLLHRLNAVHAGPPAPFATQAFCQACHTAASGSGRLPHGQPRANSPQWRLPPPPRRLVGSYTALEPSLSALPCICPRPRLCACSRSCAPRSPRSTPPAGFPRIGSKRQAKVALERCGGPLRGRLAAARGRAPRSDPFHREHPPAGQRPHDCANPAPPPSPRVAARNPPLPPHALPQLLEGQEQRGGAAGVPARRRRRGVGRAGRRRHHTHRARWHRIRSGLRACLACAPPLAASPLRACPPRTPRTRARLHQRFTY